MSCLPKDDNQIGVLCLATIFLFIIFEIIRNYMANEIKNLHKLRMLPAFWFWSRIGQTSNLLCCVFTAAALPFLFSNEMDAKDIVFDALGMLFIFTLDDLTSDAMAGLELKEDDFKNGYTWMISSLSMCPVELSDIVNPNAKSAADIWRIRLDASGLLKTSGERCFCRIMDNSDACAESDPLVGTRKLVDTPVPTKYLYTVSPGATGEIPHLKFSPMVIIWDICYFLIFAAECIVPVGFFFFAYMC